MTDIRLSILKTIAMLLVALAFILFFLSLFETVFITKETVIKGYWILATGWLGFVIFQFAWYANLLSLLAILLMAKRAGLAFILSLSALLLSSESFLFDEIPSADSDKNIAVIDTDIGLYLWIGAHCAVLYAVILMLIRKKMIEHEKVSAHHLRKIKADRSLGNKKAE
ncbi:MAG: hypothetical protein DSZ29_07245 [Aquificaceae bacterium]|nr:MAG: hypothetical protein DSZ29_07245 [Aquificaceae bacterium]